jgi:hypothetical protein
MVCGVLANKVKKSASSRSFFARHFPCPTISRSGLKTPNFTCFGRFFFWPPQLAGLNELIFFAALSFDFVDGGIAAGEPH